MQAWRAPDSSLTLEHDDDIARSDSCRHCTTPEDLARLEDECPYSETGFK